MPPGEPRSIEENSARLVRSESFTTASLRLTRDGRILQVIGSHAPIRDAAGVVVGRSILLQDDTALREAATRESEQQGRYRALIEYGPVPVRVWEHALQRILDATEAALAT